MSFVIRTFNMTDSETEFERISDKPSKVEANQCLSVRQILNKFVSTGTVPPGATDEQYGEDPTARPDFDLLDAKEQLDAIENRWRKLHKDKLAAAEAKRLADLRAQILAEQKQEQEQAKEEAE